MASGGDGERTVVQAKRALDKATHALEEAGAGAIGTLECRVDGLRGSFLSTPARNLDDIQARLELIRDLVRTLGEPGFLHHVVEATIRDVEALKKGG